MSASTMRPITASSRDSSLTRSGNQPGSLEEELMFSGRLVCIEEKNRIARLFLGLNWQVKHLQQLCQSGSSIPGELALSLKMELNRFIDSISKSIKSLQDLATALETVATPSE